MLATSWTVVLLAAATLAVRPLREYTIAIRLLKIGRILVGDGE
jgi:hypothetical protein